MACDQKVVLFNSPAVHATVCERFIDQIDADDHAIKFIEAAGLRAKESFWPVCIEWFNYDDADGRSGILRVVGKVLASVTVTRDQNNFSEVCGVSFI